MPPSGTARKASRPTGARRKRARPRRRRSARSDTAAKYALIIDYTSGATLLEKDADVPMPPSSMTKLMTAYIVYGALKSGKLKLTDELPVSERAWRMGGSKMFVQVGTSVPVEDLIRGMIVQSGNDACIVLAEGIAGSEEQFVELMNQRAKEIGLTQSNFRNATGWPDPELRMSCRDIATLASRIIQDYPEYYHYEAEKTFKYNGIEQGNRNPLVQKGTADGLKTGHTEAGGFGLVASSERNGRRVIEVLNGLTSMHQRAEEAERLMEWSFREFEEVTLFTAGDVVEHAPVWLGSRALGAARRRAESGRHAAPGLAQERDCSGHVRFPDHRAGHARRRARQALHLRPGRAAAGGDAARGRGRAEARLAGPRDGGAVALRVRKLSRRPVVRPRGRFITLEGGEGAGKSTQAGLLAQALEAARRFGPLHPRAGRRARRGTAAGAAAIGRDGRGRRRPRCCCISPRAPSMWSARSARRWLRDAGWCATGSRIRRSHTRATARAPISA